LNVCKSCKFGFRRLKTLRIADTLSNGAVIVVKGEACVLRVGTLMGLKTGAILGFQMLTFDVKRMMVLLRRVSSSHFIVAH